jgi:hypothetical protein
MVMGYNPIKGVAQADDQFDIGIVFINALGGDGVDQVARCDLPFDSAGFTMREVFGIPCVTKGKVSFGIRLIKRKAIIEKMDFLWFSHTDLGMPFEHMAHPCGSGFHGANAKEIYLE